MIGNKMGGTEGSSHLGEFISDDFLRSFVDSVACEVTRSEISRVFHEVYGQHYTLNDDGSIARTGKIILPISESVPDLSPQQANNTFIWKNYIIDKPNDNDRIKSYALTTSRHRTAVLVFNIISGSNTKISIDTIDQFFVTLRDSIFRELDIVL